VRFVICALIDPAPEEVLFVLGEGDSAVGRRHEFFGILAVNAKPGHGLLAISGEEGMAVGGGVPFTEGSEGEFCGIEAQARFVGVVITAVTPKALLSENRSDLEIVADLGGRRGRRWGGGRYLGPLFLTRKQSKDSNEKNDD
jgi:hypothetical protein